MISFIKGMFRKILIVSVSLVVSIFIIYLIGVILLIVNQEYYIIFRTFFENAADIIVVVYTTIENWFYEVFLVFLGRFSTNIRNNLKSVFHGIVLTSTLLLNWRRWKDLKPDTIA